VECIHKGDQTDRRPCGTDLCPTECEALRHLFTGSDAAEDLHISGEKMALDWGIAREGSPARLHRKLKGTRQGDAY
jgi:hypothetical protein